MIETYRVTIVLGNGKSLIFDDVAEHDLKRMLFWKGVPLFSPCLTFTTDSGTVMLDMGYVVAIEYTTKIYPRRD